MKYEVKDLNAPSRWNMRIWDGDKKVNWFDPQDKNTWQQVLEGCRPLFELFEKANNE